MRRAAILCALLGLIAAGVGCKAVTGQCDCTYDPASVQLPAASNPYPVAGATVGGAPTEKPMGK